MNIRTATDADIAAITSAYLEAWRAGYQGVLEPTKLEAEAQRRSGYDWQRAIAQPDRVVLVAEEAGEIIGVAECEHDPPLDHRAELHMLYVLPSAWGTGASTALVDGALIALQRAGHQTVWLKVVEVQARARRFYEREGWQLDETIPPESNGLVRLIHYRRDL